MTRSFHHFDCEGKQLTGTLDQGEAKAGLLIISGGNEIRSGAHAGMARLAETIAKQGFPVFRYDRRGIGESGGENGEFLSSGPDILAAAAHFRSACSNVERIVAFGNCDAATALAMFGNKASMDALILANPWVIELAETDDTPTAAPPSAIRSRYWERLKNPQTLIDLLKGQINFGKLFKGLKQAAQKQENSGLAIQLRNALQGVDQPTRILLAQRDTTARAFLGAWNSSDYNTVKSKTNIEIASFDSASHSFADEKSKNWLEEQILDVLKGA